VENILMQTNLLNDKTICVLGATGKFGKIISRAVLENGGNLIAIVRNSQRFIDIMGDVDMGKIDIIECDCFDVKALEKLFLKLKSFSIHGCVNSLSYRPMTKFMDDSLENWNLSISKNSMSMFAIARFFGKKFKKNGGGSLVFISSIYGVVGPDFDVYRDESFETEPDYPFIKGGVIVFTKYIASYFRNSNVRANCLVAGGLYGGQPPTFVEKYSQKTLLGRMADDDDITGPTIFLLSDLSKYLTGTTLTADGGWTAI
jgi:NAD(P)-dependent dehydrogenase (short-subunit alcohol dehydrogenase family)